MARSQWSHLYANRRWRRLRALHLAKHPLCAYCLKRGELKPADVVDHVEPHRGDMDKFWNGLVQSLCHACHSSVKQREEAGNVAGFDANGEPVDAWHPWGGVGRKSG